MLTTLKQHYRQLMVVYRRHWATEEDKNQAHQTLAASVKAARQTVESLQGTQDPQLLQLRGQLVLHSELADGTLKDPSMLR
jgi:hypothetical protein